MGVTVLASIIIVSLSSGINLVEPKWGVDFSSFPNALPILIFVSSYAAIISYLTFQNSLAYGALVDQVIFYKTKNGLVDPDIIRSSLESHWLIFKYFSDSFLIHNKDHIRSGSFSIFFHKVTFSITVFLISMPLIGLVFLQSYFAFSILGDAWQEIFVKLFSSACGLSCLFIHIVLEIPFKCEVDEIIDDNKIN